MMRWFVPLAQSIGNKQNRKRQSVKQQKKTNFPAHTLKYDVKSVSKKREEGEE